ncbi:type II toxin-antitoxin system RelE family toxin [Deferrisoma palaeochoriense]
MSTVEIRWKISAAKELAALPVRIQRRVVVSVERLSENPRPPSVKKLHGTRDTYRLRVGVYRVVYQVEDRSGRPTVVTIIRVRHRKEAYRR